MLLLADSVVLVVGGLFLIGFIGFFIAIVVMVVRVFGFVFRRVAGTGPRVTGAWFTERHEVCPHPRCGHVNRAGAHFCARCGRPLDAHDDLDAYG